ncbi:M28 family metallopeptidase [Pseudoxanthomonas sp. 10H]|uniref:M28 family metallopeptidase n=1 Tax=Pseudoxanthomonas sp. 10H TaxID=3242729 RepID=UPI003558BA27
MHQHTLLHRARRPALSARLFLVLLAASLAAPAAAEAPHEAVANRWLAQVAGISAGEDSAARAAAITARLDAMGVPWQEQAFEQEGRQGRNLVADLGGPADAPLLLIGAHYDRVDVGHGATDNASGVATVLELARALQARPLRSHRVKLGFWDLEEHGLLGSRAWVAAAGQEQPALYVNFDVFGWGDTLWMMTPQDGTPLVAALQAASKGEGLGFQPGDRYPPTDHLAFLKVGWPAVSFSLVGADEIPAILQVFAGQTPDPAPRVMQVIHSPQDDDSQLDAGNVPKALHVLEAGLRSLDAGPAAPRAP